MEIQIGRSLFAVKLVDAPISFAGSQFKCLVDEDACVVSLLKTLPESEKLRLLATAVSEGWSRRVVPLVWPRWDSPPATSD